MLDEVEVFDSADLIRTVFCRHDVVHVVIAEQEHAIFIVIPVVGDLVECGLSHEWSPCTYITPFVLLEILDPALHLLDDLCALRHEERKSLADNVYSREDIHLTSELVVVAVLDVCEICEILFEIFFLRESCTVDTCEHLVVLVTSPVSAGA